MGAQIVLFPYRMVASPALRNIERILRPTKSAGARRFRNLPLDVFYLVTIGSVSAKSPDAQVGLQETLWESLGRAIQALQDGPFLVGEGVGSDTVRLSLRAGNRQDRTGSGRFFPTPTTEPRSSIWRRRCGSMHASQRSPSLWSTIGRI